MDQQTLWLSILTALSLAVLAISLLTLRKTRKVHLATYPLLSDLATTRKEAEALFGQIHALLALDRKLELPHELPPMRGWAGSPDFLLVVANEILRRKPATVMECSWASRHLSCRAACKSTAKGMFTAWSMTPTTRRSPVN